MRGRLVARCPITALGLQCNLANGHGREHRYDPDDAGFADERRWHNKTRVPSLPLRRGRPPKPISERRANERDERARVVALVVARDQTCQAQAVHALAKVPCSGPLDCHERIPRSAWPGGYLEPSNVILVCRSAHDWIDNHPNGAHALGLHGYSHERP